MATTTKDVDPQYDEKEALGGITAEKVKDAGTVNLEGRVSRGAAVGSPEEVLALGEDIDKLNAKDAGTAYLDLLHRADSSTREQQIALARLGESVGWENPDVNQEPANHDEDNLPPSRVERAAAAEKAAAKAKK